MNRDHLEQTEWIKSNNQYFVFAEEISYIKKVIHKPSLITFDLDSYVGPSAKLMIEWIKRHTDTSIKIDKYNTFKSLGTNIYKLDNVIVNCATHDIAIPYKSNLLLLDCSHHGRDCYSWILRRNNIKSIKPYLGWLKDNLNQSNIDNSRDKVILNPRWSATNFYHWFHEAMPRIITLLRNGFIDNETDLYWIGKEKPRGYHLIALRSIGIIIENIQYIDGIVNIKNLTHCTMVQSESFSKEQSDILNTIAYMIKGFGPNKLTKITGRRLLILRRKGGFRSFAFKHQIDYMIARYSLEPIILEEYSLIDQINIMQNAECLIAPHGAGLTHLLWMSQGTRVTEFMPRDSIHPLYWYLSGISGMKYSMIPSRITLHNQQIIVDINELDDHILL